MGFLRCIFELRTDPEMRLLWTVQDTLIFHLKQLSSF